MLGKLLSSLVWSLMVLVVLVNLSSGDIPMWLGFGGALITGFVIGFSGD